MIATAKRKTEVMTAFPLFTAEDLREVEASAYESGLNAHQPRCERWFAAGLLLGVFYVAGIWFLTSL